MMAVLINHLWQSTLVGGLVWLAIDPNGPSLFTGLQEQLGLKLVP